MLKAPSTVAPPKAARKSYSASHHGYTFEDPYFWLKDPGYPDVTDEAVLGYLKEENSYFKSVMGAHQALTDTLFEEIKGRVKEDDESVPWFDGDFEYRWAFAKGTEYRIWSRRPRAGSDWVVFLDENREAEGKEFFKLGGLAISPCGRYLAFSADSNGSERFTARLRDLDTGQDLSEEIVETSGEIVWAADSSGFFYVHVSKEWRPYLVNFHTLGGKDDQKVYEEKDTSFFVHIGHTSSRSHLVIKSADHVTAECHVIPLDAPLSAPQIISARKTKHDYGVDHDGQGHFYIRSNRDEQNFSVFKVPEKDLTDGNWQLVLAGTDQLYLTGVKTFRDFVAVEERQNGLDQVRLMFPDGSHKHIAMPEPVYEVGLATNAEFDQGHVRLGYSSLVTPPSVFDYSVADDTLVLRKEQEIPSGYNKDEYTSERLTVAVRDGVQVPVSVVYKKGWQKGGPVHLYGYGAYGLGTSPGFSVTRLSLLDRGFAYAIAHVRGGDELGYGWYEDGKLEKRTNTFNDFVDVARELTTSGYAEKGGISISGGSAGGELMGAVVNQAPELFKGVVLHVPFVDVLNTMLDADLPLTPIEWPEWGNPIEDKAAFENIRSYCPYTNIEAKDYPPMMVTGGLNDPRVTYWEPAKWTAKLRATKTDDAMLIMKINMGAGHGGKSGRFERFHEVAEEYTFLLMAFDLI